MHSIVQRDYALLDIERDYALVDIGYWYSIQIQAHICLDFIVTREKQGSNDRLYFV
jgi:hypothetical protein